MVIADWLGSGYRGCIAPHNIRNMVESLLNFAALPNNIPMADISTHSLRSGWATTSFHVGVDMGTIQKWGRWNRQCFLRYIRFSANGMRKLSVRTIQCKPSISQLETAVVPQKRARFQIPMITISGYTLSIYFRVRSTNPTTTVLDLGVCFPILTTLSIPLLIVAMLKLYWFRRFVWNRIADIVKSDPEARKSSRVPPPNAHK